MKNELRILFLDVASTDALCQVIERRSSSLERTVDPEWGCHVSVERLGSGPAAQFKVQVHATAIDGQPVVGQGEHRDCLRAVDNAFDIAQWQLAERAAAVWTAASSYASMSPSGAFADPA